MMQRLHIVFIFFITLTTLFLISCGNASVQTPQNNIQNQVKAPPPPFSETTSLPPLPTREIQITTPVATQVQSIVVQNQKINWLIIDNSYLYWISSQEPQIIYRHAFTGGANQIIATSLYTDGNLISLQPIRSSDWLVFLDTPTSSGNTSWKLRALNVVDGSQQTIIEEIGDPASWPGPWMDVSGDMVVWTRTGSSKKEKCIENILGLRNLKSGEEDILDRVCVENNYMWSSPHISDGNIVVEKDLPSGKGSGNNIYSINISSKEKLPLTTDNQSSMPLISSSWMAWKAANQFKPGEYIIISDLQSFEQYALHVPIVEPPDPLITSHWLYWNPSPHQSFYMYDLMTKRLLNVATPERGMNISAVSVHGNMIAWSQTEDNSDQASGSIISWKVLP